MTIDLPSAAAGFGIASLVLGFLATYVFATKSDIAKVRSEADRFVKEHAEAESSDMRRLFDKIDKMAEGMTDLRVKVAELRYSRGQQPGDRAPGSDSSTFPRVR